MNMTKKYCTEYCNWKKQLHNCRVGGVADLPTRENGLRETGKEGKESQERGRDCEKMSKGIFKAKGLIDSKGL